MRDVAWEVSPLHFQFPPMRYLRWPSLAGGPVVKAGGRVGGAVVVFSSVGVGWGVLVKVVAAM